MRKFSIKFTVAVSAFFMCAVFLNALPFNSKLTSSDIKKLENGEVITRSIDKYKNISIEGENPAIQSLRSQIKDLEPNYLAEVIQIRPYEGNEDLAQKLYDVLVDIPHYAGIQYWSVQHERYYDLYSTAEIKEETELSETKKAYKADLYMEPFGMIHTPIEVEKTDDYIVFSMGNSNDLKFNGKISCIKKRHMKSVIILLRDGDSWILYGAGGCKAAKIAILQKRIETSFINRIKTFCNYVFTKI